MISLFLPSKTFILGEYGVLKGGAALLVNTSPAFEMKVIPREDKLGKVKGIHSESPAGRFIFEAKDFFSKYDIEFLDPHVGLGGLGASSAQFAMAYCFYKKVTDTSFKHDHLRQIQRIIKIYREVAWQGTGFVPSGADIVSQLLGSLAFVYSDCDKFEKLNWPFTDLNFYIIRTGEKISTHAHLNQLQKASFDKYSEIAMRGYKSLVEENSLMFLDSVSQMTDTLASDGLVTNHTLSLIEKLHQRPEVLACKGCGAMGADTIFTLVKVQDSKTFTSWCEDHSLRIVGSNKVIDEGLRVTQSSPLKTMQNDHEAYL